MKDRGNMKKLLSLITIVIALSTPFQAFGDTTCNDVIKACNEAIQARNKELELTVIQLNKSEELRRDLEIKLQDAKSPGILSNPFLWGIVGLVIGVAVTK